MELDRQLDIDHGDRKDVYDYVERHGAVRADDIRAALSLDREGLGAHLTVLRRDGYLREREDGRYEVAYDLVDPREYETDDGAAYTVRAAGQFDHGELVDAIRDVAEDGRYIEAETVADVIDHEEVVLRHNDTGSRMVFVATVAEDIVGWVHLDLPEAEKLRHTAVLTVGVVEAHRGRGIGDRLLERGTEWARDRGYEKLYNSVPATNDTAIAFLEDHGWETEAVRDDHYRIDGDYVDEVMMARRLEA
ncbi:MAG: N-acetyltransferase family protein [Halolamina sp.]